MDEFNRVASVQIETIDYCNRKCPWCPNSTRKQSKDSFMSYDTLDLILDSLVDAGYKGRIHPFLNGEPLCDPRFPDIIARIREKLPKNIICLFTNGDFLTKDLFIELAQNGVNWFIVNDYDDKGHNIPWLSEAMRSLQNPPSIEVVQRHEITWWYNRGGNIAVECADKKDKCEFVFHKMYFNWKGQSVLCCSDFYSTIIMGDIHNSSVKEIWNSQKYFLYRAAHELERGYTMPLCNTCNRINKKEVLWQESIQKTENFATP